MDKREIMRMCRTVRCPGNRRFAISADDVLYISEFSHGLVPPTEPLARWAVFLPAPDQITPEWVEAQIALTQGAGLND